MRIEKIIYILVFLVTLAVPLIVLLIYRNQISGLIFSFSMRDVSHKADDWSAFGSLLSGLFTLSGAIGTVATLIFAIHQNKQLSKEAKKRADQDEESAKKNEEFMSFQKERISFEKFKIHQSMFNDLLDKIEKDSKGQFYFHSRSVLYKNLFPHNSFSNCITKGDIEDSTPSNLKDLHITCLLISDKFRSDLYYKDASEFLRDVMKIQNSLMVTIERKAQEGDLLFAGKYIVFNVVDIYSSLSFYENATNMLCSFCESGDRVDITSYVNYSRLILSISNFTANLALSKAITPSFPFEYKDLPAFSQTVSLYKIFEVPSDHPLYKFLRPLQYLVQSALTPENAANLASKQGFRDFLTHFVIQVLGTKNAIMKESPELATSFDPYIEKAHKMLQSLN